MGAGCSSPLRRLGGKRGKPTRRESSPFNGELNGEGENREEHYTITKGQHEQQQQQQQAQQEQPSNRQTKVGHNKFVPENEITIQSELNEDHPSTASYYTDGKNHHDETKASDHSVAIDPKSGSQSASSAGQSSGAATAATRIMGLNGSYAPHDRHLLVSPALSPAPSTCYSPSPASSTLGSATLLDLNELNEAFKTLTFGPPNRILTAASNQAKITQSEQQQSDLHNYYTQQLVQTKNDLINYISVIFITTDSIQLLLQDDINKQQQTILAQQNSNLNSFIGSLADNIESNLKAFCDEHLFNLRFLNLSQAHLSEHIRVNNLLDASMRILEQEYQENSQRIIVIVLSNNNITPNVVGLTDPSNAPPASIASKQNQSLDGRQLPTKIQAQSMNKLLAANTENSDFESTKDLFKRWYNQVGNMFHLNPIYLVYPKILSDSKEERELSWQNWLNESNHLLKAIKLIQENDSELASDIKLKSLFSTQIDYIMRDPALQKRTLLIRNYSQQVNSIPQSIQQQQQQQSSSSSASTSLNKDGLNEFARILADPNKLTLKGFLSDHEFIRTINDWISENFSKFFDNILENQIVHGKHAPPFIEPNLFVELTCQRNYLEHYLDTVTENFETKCQSFYTNQISPILDGIINLEINSKTPLTSSQITSSPDDQQSSTSAAQPSTNHLVFISGPKGCGKSTLFAQIIKFATQDLFNKAQIIYRFCGVTLDSFHPNRLFRSICEQFCQTQGENTTAASYIYSNRKEIINALNKIIKLQVSLIFLDGLDVIKQSNESDLGLDWLCEIEAKARIKIFIMLETDSSLYKKALSTYSDATYISLDYPTIGEWAQMLTSTAKSEKLNPAANLYEEVKKIDQADLNGANLNYNDIKNIIQMCRIRQQNNESIYPELNAKLMQNNPLENFRNVHRTVLLHLQCLLSPYQLCALFIMFESTRCGLIELDIINIMTMISQSAKAAGRADFRFSSSLFNYLKILLQPWIVYIICDRMVKITIQRDFVDKVFDYYSSSLYPNIVSEVREILIEYFNRQSRASTSSLTKGFKSERKSDGNILEPKANINQAERSWLATQASEIVNLLILTNPTKAKEHILNKYQFFSQFLYGSTPEEFIEDSERLKDVAGKKSSSSGDELQYLVNYIRQSVYPLRYDGSQIYSQIYCRSHDATKSSKFSKSKKFNEIISIASCPPLRNLLPISEASINSFIKMRIGQPTLSSSPQSTGASSALNASSSSASSLQKQVTKSSVGSNYQSLQASQVQAKQRIFTIKDNHRHVIVIYPDKGSLSVWDIYEEKSVRTLKNLDQPRDLRMIDQKCAVILCNRELRVYDLDSGAMLNKLKGVMNQKMPFFEVFGDNYVVALARNRMYVNMLNLSTGELETTFKVGEDRFLNSLLVSANGGICVCGDETQKPFPLLVWNLNERRLLYDLRLERHEFLTRMSAISDDGHFVVSVCKQVGDGDGYGASSTNTTSNNSYMSDRNGLHKSSPNFIVIYDLNSGTLFKKWKPGLDSCAVAISLSANRSGKVINTIVDSSILVWDLATGSKRHTLIGHSAPADVIRVQNGRLFSMDSTNRDQSLRIWDIEEGHCLAVFSPDAPVNCCQISLRGDALVCGFAADTRLSTLVLCKNETVNDVVKRNKRRKSSKSIYIFDEPPSRKSSS